MSLPVLCTRAPAGMRLHLVDRDSECDFVVRPSSPRMDSDSFGRCGNSNSSTAIPNLSGLILSYFPESAEGLAHHDIPQSNAL
jgi:hypothetical protein